MKILKVLLPKIEIKTHLIIGLDHLIMIHLDFLLKNKMDFDEFKLPKR